MKTIAIIIPVYNGEKYIDDCLYKISQQSISNYEVICINDGSSDKTGEKLKAAQKQYEFLRVITKSNEGAGAARNDGIVNANAEFISFMDIDDYYPDEKTLETLYETAKKNNAIICGGFIKAPNLQNDEKYKFPKEGFISYSEYQYDFGFTRFIYNKHFLIKNKIVFPKRSTFEDPIFLMNALHEAKQFYALNKCVYIYTEPHHTELNVKQTLDYLSGLQEALKFAEKNHYALLYKLNYERLLTSGQYYAEKNYRENPEEIFNILVRINGEINYDLLHNSENKIPAILPTLQWINSMAVKYETITSSKLLSLIKRIVDKHGKK